MTETVLAASAIPMALVGGIFALVLTGIPFSVSAAIGFVALFGISAMNGMIVIAYFNTLIDAGLERSAAIARACAVRVAGRPFDRRRLTGPKVARSGRGRRQLFGAAVDLARDAGGDRPLFAPEGTGRGARAATRAGRIEMLGIKGAGGWLFAIGVVLTRCAVGRDFERPAAAPDVY
jgi:hypothetical protein